MMRSYRISLLVITLVSPFLAASQLSAQAIPSGWSDGDIGSVGLAGSSSYANNVFTVSGAGSTIGGTADSFHFAYQSLSGDGTIVGRVVSFSGAWADQAGVMIRETLNAGSANVFMCVQTTSAPYLELWDRPSTGANTVNPSYLAVTALPYWLKLVRSGNTFTSFYSIDGLNWVQLSTSQTVSMAQNVYIGLGVSNHSTTTLGTATFDNVSITSTGSPAPVISSASATTGPVGTQVVLSGSGFGASQNGSQVFLSDTAASINSWGNSSITLSIPSGAASGSLVASIAASMNDSNPVPFTITSQPLPSGWLDQDVGTVGSTGSATYANNVFTINGAGNNAIGSTADQFHFVYQPLSGDGTIIARVVGDNRNYGEAAVMIRATLDSGSPMESVYYQYVSSPGSYMIPIYRTTSGGSAVTPSGYLSNVPLPYWEKVARTGNNFAAYWSSDGVNWNQFSTLQSISMGQTVYIGLGASSKASSPTATVSFDNVSVSTTALPAPQITSLSATEGPVGTQVTIYGSGFGASQGTSAVLLGGIPMTVNSWSNSTIAITISSGAGSGPVIVSVAPSMNDSNPIDFTITSQPIPTSFLDSDVGSVGIAGSASYASGVFTLKGGGNLTPGSGGTVAPDGLHFVYQPLSGDGTIVARIVTESLNYGFAGVMMRETFDGTSPMAFMGYKNPPSSQIVFGDRLLSGTNGTLQVAPAAYYLPYWVKLVRSGNTFSGYMSPDGVNWQQAAPFQPINMSQTIYVGIFSAGTTTTLNTSTIDNVSISTPTSAAPTITGLSATSGIVGNQITISGRGFGGTQSTSVVLLNDAPMTVNSWSDTSISITIASGANSGYLVVSVAPSMNDSNPAVFTVTSQPLPSPWLDQDVGAVGKQGNAAYASGVFTIQGAGNGVGVTADGLHFVYQPLATGGTIVARLASATGGSLTQAGVMVRETLDSYSTNVLAWYGTGAQRTSLGYRTIPGGATAETTGTTITLPYWFKIVRGTNTFAGYTSPDGVNWTQIGTTQTFTTAQTVYVGLGVSSSNVSTLATATFDNVGVSAGSSLSDPVVSGFSPTSGGPGAQVTINGSGFGATQGTSTVSFNGVPATVYTWADGQIVAFVPTGATTGPISVTVGNITGSGPTFNVMLNAQVTDSLGNQSSYTSSPFGGQWAFTDATGSGCSSCTARGTIHNQYDSNGNLLWTTDALDNTVSYQYDSSSNLISQFLQVNPSTVATTSYTYNGFGEVLTATDALGHVTTNAYDSHGNLTSVTTPAPGTGATASVTQFTYNSVGELTQITDTLNNITTLTYTTAGLIATIKDAQNNVTTYGYDAHGNRTSVTDALNHQTTFAYDSGDRLTTITYPDSTTTTFGYDYRGRRTSVTDQNGKVTTYAYDDADRLTSVTDAANNQTQYTYDTENNLTSITDANGHETTFTYDAFGRVTQTNFPSTLSETYSYDANSNLTSKTDRKGQTIQYVYDALNRLTKKLYPDSTEVDYVYDLVSRIQQVNDPTGTYGFAYDNMGRLIGTTTSYSFLTGRNFTTAYAYDKASNRTGFTDPESGSTAYVYDTLNRLQTLTPPTAFTTGSFGFTYDALSRRTQMTRPNSVATNYAYDNLSRLQSVLHQLSGSTIDGASYGLDSAGNRTSKTDYRAGVTSNYAYDAIYELTGVTQGTNTTESYTYDPVGNRLSSLGVSPYSVNLSNELSSTPSATYTYDANGNIATKTDSSGTTNYTWDFENRLASVALPGSGGSVYFKYDPLGRRIYKSSSLGTSVFAYDLDNLIEETNASGGVVARYSQGLNVDEPLAELRSGATSYYQADGLGTLTSLSNASGALANTYTYDSFGNVVVSSGSIVNSFRYTGRESDSETGLYYYRARYYDPSIGRFASEDPMRFNGSVNFYESFSNEPTNYTDPLGLKTTVCCRRLHYVMGKIGLAHCYLKISEHGGSPHTYGLHREDPTGKKFPEGAKPIVDDPTDVGGTCKDVSDATPCKEIDLESRYKSVPCPSCGPDFDNYNPFTTNSNYWVSNILRQFAMTPPNFYNAPGYNYDPSTFPKFY
jgi:RHS repeat-associated protein